MWSFIIWYSFIHSFLIHHCPFWYSLLLYIHWHPLRMAVLSKLREISTYFDGFPPDEPVTPFMDLIFSIPTSSCFSYRCNPHIRSGRYQFDHFNGSDIWQASWKQCFPVACQITKRVSHRHHRFETLRYYTIRRLIKYCNGVKFPLWIISKSNTSGNHFINSLWGNNP